MDPRRVLHIGSDSKGQNIPTHFRGWERICFDINPRHDAEYVGDVRNMAPIADESFEAAYLCRVAELFHPWEVPQILAEATRVVKTGGFVEIRVPHIEAIMGKVLEGHAMDAPLYHTDAGPMTPQNLLYGRIGRTRNAATFMAHRIGFTPQLLRREMQNAGLKVELLGASSDQAYELFCIGRKINQAVIDPIDAMLEAVVTTS